MTKENKTTIQVEIPTLERLKNNKLVAKESYEELINRVLDAVENQEK